MTDHLHPQRASYPLVNTDDELVLVFRHHIPAELAPTLYVKAIGDAEFRIDASRTLDERAGLFVVSFAAGAGDTITLTVNGGAPTVLTAGIQFTAAVSNAATAISIAAAINTAALGLVATYDETRAFVYVAAGTTPAGVQVKTFTIASGDLTAWTPEPLAFIGSVNTLTNSQVTSFQLPAGTADTLKTVMFIRMFSGRVSVDVRSPVEFRSYFRQPVTLRQTTGHPGGWPISP
jgi:hypothetical protein